MTYRVNSISEVCFNSNVLGSHLLTRDEKTNKAVFIKATAGNMTIVTVKPCPH